MDNARENKELAASAKEMGKIIEMTAPNTPQMNAVVGGAFAVCAANGRAMMNAVHLPNNLRGTLWAECFNTASILGNLMPVGDRKALPMKMFFGKSVKFKWKLHPF